MSTHNTLPDLIKLAETQLNARDFSAARDTLSKARELAPHSSAILQALVVTGIEIGDLTSSVEAASSIPQGDPFRAQAFDMIRSARGGYEPQRASVGTDWKGDLETLSITGDHVGVIKKIEALEAYTQALPQNVLLLKAQRLSILGRFEEALQSVAKELSRFPGNEEARQEFERLSDVLGRNKVRLVDLEQRSFSSALPRDVLASIQKAGHCYSYRGVPMIKNPFDFAIYPLLMWREKPSTIIEIGSKSGGSAIWFGDMLQNFGIEGHIYSVDIMKVTGVSHPRVTFMEGNGRRLEELFSRAFLEALPRPLLVIEDADHSYDTSIAVLRFFESVLRPGEMIIVEDGIISDLEGDKECNSGPHRAIKEFYAAHRGAYTLESEYADFFGYNFTWCTNGFLRKMELR